LQSLNEELETAKEELQSTNEELITVNDELQAKNAALAQALDFTRSIVETVRQPLLVLDTELRIKMANRAFYRTFQTSPLEAEGQVIYSLSRGSWDLPGLRDSLDRLSRAPTRSRTSKSNRIGQAWDTGAWCSVPAASMISK
jgi:two-component system CheB/CheR fusion protein